jgi:predicted DNA-binding protein
MQGGRKMASNTVTATFSVSRKLYQEINDLAAGLGKKKSQIFEEAIAMYSEATEDFRIARKYDRISQDIEDGKIKTHSLEEVETIINAKL